MYPKVKSKSCIKPRYASQNKRLTTGSHKVLCSWSTTHKIQTLTSTLCWSPTTTPTHYFMVMMDQNEKMCEVRYKTVWSAGVDKTHKRDRQVFNRSLMTYSKTRLKSITEDPGITIKNRCIPNRSFNTFQSEAKTHSTCAAIRSDRKQNKTTILKK
jgi:trehalose/maltose hydrolase-like predicted phosphorylase